jgi:hypothetical protein
MNAGRCVLLPDGEGVDVIDRKSGEQRECTYQDWWKPPSSPMRWIQIGLYWSMVGSSGIVDLYLT